jgi:hypothetical protein
MNDSGKKDTFSTGAVRDTIDGKPMMELLPLDLLLRVSDWYTLGAKKYGFSEVYESLLLSISQYQSESISKAVSYTPRICANRVKQKNDPLLHKKNTLKYIIKTRHLRSFVEYDRFNELFEWIDGEEPVLDIIIEMANKSVSYRDFWNKVEKYKENI